MKRVIITTCGTSLLQSSCWNYELIKDKHFSQKKDEVERGEHELKCKTVLTAARESGANISEKFNRFSWDNIDYLRDLSAELASLRAIQIYSGRKFDKELGKDDKIILLHSDNKDGKYCAEQLKQILTGFDLLKGINIEKLSVNGLDPRDSSQFGKALLEIWKNFIEISENKEEKYIFNLTGGYKVTAILMGAIAYFASNVDLFYLHEETNFEEIFIMGFDKTMKKENRFYTGSYNLNDLSVNVSPPSPEHQV